MPKYRITAPDGGTYEVTAPDGASEAEVMAYAQKNYAAPKPKGESATPRSTLGMLKDEALTSLPGGLARGVKDVIDTGAEYLSKLGGAEESAKVKAGNDAGEADFKDAQERAGVGGSSAARVGGQVLATLPVGPALGAGAKAAGMTRLGNALATGGMTTGAPAATTIAGKAVDMGLRMAGGAGTGYAAADLIEPGAGTAGAAFGAALPPVVKVAGYGGNALSSLIRPFTARGQERTVGDVLRQFSTNPEALRNLERSFEMIPGSAPTAVMAAGDEGLAGLSRTLQSADPRYAAELSTRAAAQNAARTAAMEQVAGNTGKLTLAKEARDAATGPMREAVLDAAGKFDAQPILSTLDRMLADPNNAGKLAQQALTSIKNQIAGKPGMHGGARVGGFIDDAGKINARALYAIRKDINDVLAGKLQGDAGNLRHASGQLIGVKQAIDEAIDQASRRVEMSASREVLPFGANIERAGAAGPFGSMRPRPTWAGYLDEFTQRSIPINQMEKLDDVLKAISTGTVDQSGNAVLSAAKLNNLLRNQAKDLQKVLAPDQLQLLRKLSADLNAGQLANNAGRAVGSNTVQNLAGANALNTLMGAKLGGSVPMQATLGRALQFAYKAPNNMIQNRLAAALLDPQEAARLLTEPQTNALLRALSESSARIGYRTAPAIAAQ